MTSHHVVSRGGIGHRKKVPLPLMGWTGCFPLEDSLEGLTAAPEKQPMDTNTPALASIGIDIGKEVFHIVGLVTNGKIAFRRKIKRLALVDTFKALGHSRPSSRAPANFAKPRRGSHFYSITSSARASSVGGTVRPSAFAALRLIVSSNLVGCTTGKFAGRSPFRIRPQ